MARAEKSLFINRYQFKGFGMILPKRMIKKYQSRVEENVYLAVIDAKWQTNS